MTAKINRLSERGKEEDVFVSSKDCLNDSERQKQGWHIQVLADSTLEDARRAAEHSSKIAYNLDCVLQSIRVIEAALRLQRNGCRTKFAISRKSIRQKVAG